MRIHKALRLIFLGEIHYVVDLIIFLNSPIDQYDNQILYNHILNPKITGVAVVFL